jgi:DNA-binding transcriptional ArsR family regulator
LMAVDVALWADKFGVFACTTRLNLLLVLRRSGPMRVGELAEVAGLAPVTTSAALRLLRIHGLVQRDRRGRAVRYAIADHAANRFLDAIDPSIPPRLVDVVGSRACGLGSRGKREPGGIPGLPRSGEWNDRRQQHWERSWEATASRSVQCARESEDLPSARASAGARGSVASWAGSADSGSRLEIRC